MTNEQGTPTVLTEKELEIIAAYRAGKQAEAEKQARDKERDVIARRIALAVISALITEQLIPIENLDWQDELQSMLHGASKVIKAQLDWYFS